MNVFPVILKTCNPLASVDYYSPWWYVFLIRDIRIKNISSMPSGTQGQALCDGAIHRVRCKLNTVEISAGNHQHGRELSILGTLSLSVIAIDIINHKWPWVFMLMNPGMFPVQWIPIWAWFIYQLINWFVLSYNDVCFVVM
jgi:hypothetical protein